MDRGANGFCRLPQPDGCVDHEQPGDHTPLSPEPQEGVVDLPVHHVRSDHEETQAEQQMRQQRESQQAGGASGLPSERNGDDDDEGPEERDVAALSGVENGEGQAHQAIHPERDVEAER